LLVFVAAERRELEGLLVHVDEVTKPSWPLEFARRGRLNGVPIVMLANGPGPKLARVAVDAAKENESMDGLISTGFCGGLNPALRACDIFVATEIVGVASALTPSSSRPFQAGKLLSMDRVVSSAAEKAELSKSADAVEMEAAAVAERAREWGVPFYSIRVVTDTSEENFPLDFNQMRAPVGRGDGRFSRSKIIAAALRSPATVVPELIKLNKRTKCAARALGDFLADARF
jgi:adenosylhomocysteine nucleosidase